jgi:hypothetical protein
MEDRMTRQKKYQLLYSTSRHSTSRPATVSSVERPRLSMKPRLQPRPMKRRDGVITSLHPLTFDAGELNLAVSTVHLFPDRGSYVFGFVTARGTASFVLPAQLAKEVADGLARLILQQQGSTTGG